MSLITARARAYANFGRWVADCPTGCGCALQLNPNQTLFNCVECHVIVEIEWPSNADDIWEALQLRQHNKNKNWYPAGHEVALRANCPHGQTVEELRAEGGENAPAVREAEEERKQEDYEVAADQLEQIKGEVGSHDKNLPKIKRFLFGRH